MNKPSGIPEELLNTKLDDLIPTSSSPHFMPGVHGRIRNCLRWMSDKPIVTIRDLMAVPRSSFVLTPNVGKATLHELERILANVNIRLAGRGDLSSHYFGPMEEPHAVFSLEMHKNTVVDDHTTAMRVPGGWIYKLFETDGRMAVCFVPASVH
jgi:hypothetical protein